MAAESDRDTQHGASSSWEADEQSDVTSARLVRNTVINGASNVSSALVTVILLPVLLNQLGPDEYGLWLLALGITFTNGYLALADLGLPEAAVKFIAEARARRLSRTISEIASTTAALFTLVGASLAFMLALIAPVLSDLFEIRTELTSVARTVFVLMAFEILVALPGAAFRAVIEGAQRYALIAVIDIGSRVGWGVVAVAVVTLGHGVVALAVTSLLATTLKTAATIVGAFSTQPDLQISRSAVKRSTFRQTLSYGSFIGGLRFLSVIYGQMDRIIIGTALGVAAVARYEIAFRMSSLATLAMTVARSAVLPAAAYNAARGDTERQRELFLRGTKYSVALVVPVAVAGLLYAKPIIGTWIGQDYTSMTRASQLFLILPLFACTNQLGGAMLIGLGRAKDVLWMQLVSVAVNLAVSLVLVESFGVTGVIIGTLVGQGLIWGPYARLLIRTFSVTVATWLRNVVVPNIPGAAVQVASGLLTLQWAFRRATLFSVAVVCVASVSLNFAVFVLVGIRSEERRHLLTRLGWHPEATVPTTT